MKVEHFAGYIIIDGTHHYLATAYTEEQAVAAYLERKGKEAVMANVKTYKALVEQIIGIQTEEDFNRACGAVDMAYQQGEKITYADHEQLFRLLGRISANQ